MERSVGRSWPAQDRAVVEKEKQAKGPEFMSGTSPTDDAGRHVLGTLRRSKANLRRACDVSHAAVKKLGFGVPTR